MMYEKITIIKKWNVRDKNNIYSLLLTSICVNICMCFDKIIIIIIDQSVYKA